MPQRWVSLRSEPRLRMHCIGAMFSLIRAPVRRGWLCWGNYTRQRYRDGTASLLFAGQLVLDRPADWSLRPRCLFAGAGARVCNSGETPSKRSIDRWPVPVVRTCNAQFHRDMLRSCMYANYTLSATHRRHAQRLQIPARLCSCQPRGVAKSSVRSLPPTLRGSRGYILGIDDRESTSRRHADTGNRR